MIEERSEAESGVDQEGSTARTEASASTPLYGMLAMLAIVIGYGIWVSIQ